MRGIILLVIIGLSIGLVACGSGSSGGGSAPSANNSDNSASQNDEAAQNNETTQSYSIQLNGSMAE